MQDISKYVKAKCKYLPPDQIKAISIYYSELNPEGEFDKFKADSAIRINAIIESINPDYEKLYQIWCNIKKLEAKYYKLHNYTDNPDLSDSQNEVIKKELAVAALVKKGYDFIDARIKINDMLKALLGLHHAKYLLWENILLPLLKKLHSESEIIFKDAYDSIMVYV